MGQILHGSATTTHTIRAKIQASEESIRNLAELHNINPKTVHKWKNRNSVEDQKCGCKPGQGSVLTGLDEAVIIETRRKTLLPLDDLLDLLQPQIPVLTRSNLHRCLQRHGVSRLADLLPPDEKTPTKAFKDYQPGFLHIDTARSIRVRKNGICLLPLTGRHAMSISSYTTTNAWKPPPHSYGKLCSSILSKSKKY